MQVPEHVVSFYVATCGQNGPGLGSDEKEIILLVYVILEAATGQVSFFLSYHLFSIYMSYYLINSIFISN